MVNILTTRHLTRSIGPVTLVDDISVEVPTGKVLAVLLSGSSPVYAAIYQFVVLAMILTASGLTSLVSTLLIRARAFTPAAQLQLR